MLVYHVDRLGTMTPGVLPLMPIEDSAPSEVRFFADSMFPEGISYAGHVFLKSVPLTDNSNPEIKEIEFEYIRRIWFPEMPSRYQSLFASRTLTEAFSWRYRLCKGKSYPNTCIWEIEAPDHAMFDLDASWRDIVHRENGVRMYSVWRNYSEAHAYWSRRKTEQTRMEVVLPLSTGQVRAIRRVAP